MVSQVKSKNIFSHYYFVNDCLHYKICETSALYEQQMSQAYLIGTDVIYKTKLDLRNSEITQFVTAFYTPINKPQRAFDNQFRMQNSSKTLRFNRITQPFRFRPKKSSVFLFEQCKSGRSEVTVIQRFLTPRTVS